MTAPPGTGIYLVVLALAASCDDRKDAGENDVEPTPVTLSGDGIPQRYAPGCSPSSGTDFMETEPWDVRRIEPYDCALVQISTPVVTWVQPRDFDPSRTFAVRLTREASPFEVTYFTAVPRLLVPRVLEAGTYHWTVSYTNANGAEVVSQPRRFVIPTANQQLLAIPTGASLVTTILARSHPRALPAGSSFSTIASRAVSGEYSQSYAGFLAAATSYVTASIAPAPADLTINDFANEAAFEAWKAELRHLGDKEATAIETLGYAYQFTGTTSYRDAALARLRALAAWPPNGATSELNQDQVNRQIYRVLALGLDLFDATLTTGDRQLLVGTLKQRLGQVLPKFAGLARYPYDSHLLTAAWYATEALMYVAGTQGFPEASDLLASAWEVMITTHGSFGSAIDAGYGNGDAYGWYSAGTMATKLATIKLMTDLDLHRWAAAGRFGDNQIAMTPPGAKLRGQFGDALEEDDHYAQYSFDAHRLLAAVTGNAAYDWYWRATPSNVTYRWSLPPVHYLMLGVSGTEPSRAPATLPSSYLFEDAGIVAMHTRIDDPARTSVFFRSSRFGSFNHSHADNNSFTFVSRGKELLISGGYYDYYNSPHHALVTRATRFKNALTFDGGIGQAEPTPSPTAPGAPYYSMEARGRLVNFADDGTWVVSTGDATLAYRGRDAATNQWTPLVSAAYRTVAFNRVERVVVIYDWARSGSARTWELNFQTLYATSLVTDPGLPQASLKLVNGASTACVDVYAPAGSYSMTTGWPVAPTKTVSDQFQTRYTVSSPSTELTAVTVIREDCRAVPVEVSMPGGSTARIRINDGGPLVADGLTVQVPAP
jgi:hypothetical protein